MIQTEMNGQKVGSCEAMSPGVRKMPAPMMLPTVTARPKVRPRTVRSDLRLDNAQSVTSPVSRVPHAGHRTRCSVFLHRNGPVVRRQRDGAGAGAELDAARTLVVA